MPGEPGTLSGRLAIVTGGGGCIGSAICHLLAEKGARVVVAGRTVCSIEAVALKLPAHQLGHRAVQVDVGDADSVERLFDAVKSISDVAASIVVNCAGYIHPHTPDALDITEEVFEQSVRVNFKGTLLVSQAAARAMLEAGITDGAIVNVSSRVAYGATPGLAVYGACKAAVVSLTRTMAAELAPRGIRCNVVLPGLTDSPAVDGMPEDVLKKLCTQIPLKRTAEPREVAEVVVFLCCPQSSYVVGSEMVVAGGRQ